MTSGQEVQQSLAAVVSAVAGSTLRFAQGPKEQATVQVDGITIATVVLEGRLDPLAQWVVLGVITNAGVAAASITANGAYGVPYAMPEMRLRVSAYTSGTINGWVKA